LLFGEDAAVSIEVSGLEAVGLLGAASSFPDEHKQVFEVLVARVAVKRGELLRREDQLSPSRRGLLHVLDRVLLDEPLLNCPIQGPADGDEAAALVAIGLFRVDPSLYV